MHKNSLSWRIDFIIIGKKPSTSSSSPFFACGSSQFYSSVVEMHIWYGTQLLVVQPFNTDKYHVKPDDDIWLTCVSPSHPDHRSPINMTASHPTIQLERLGMRDQVISQKSTHNKSHHD
jgi:hypothetical protein